jgi:hypothetical protein
MRSYNVYLWVYSRSLSNICFAIPEDHPSHQEPFGKLLPLGQFVRICKAMQGHPSAGTWWSTHFDKECAPPLILVPAFTEPTIYRRAGSITDGPTLVTHQVDDIMASAATSRDCRAVLNRIASKVSFKISGGYTKLFCAMDIDQTAWPSQPR